MLRDGWADLVLGTSCIGCSRPGRTLCVACRARLAVPATIRVEVPELSAVAAGEYDGLLRAAILAHKEDGVWALAQPLGRLLARTVPSSSHDLPLILVPAPSARAATRRRGYDPTGRIVRVAAQVLRRSGVRAAAVPLLTQIRPVADQAGLSAAERHTNLERALVVRPAVRRRLAQGGPKLRLVVCDDVLTTGATAREACRALSAAGLPPAAVVVLAASRLRRSQAK